MLNQRLLTVVLALSIGSSSCWLRKPQARVFAPPAPRPRPPIPTSPPEVAPAPEMIIIAGMELPEIPTVLPPVGPPPVPRRPQPAPTPRPAPAPVAAPGPDVPVEPLPKLTEQFSAEDLKEKTQELAQRLERVKRLLSVIGGKRLNAEQSKTVQLIASFQKQAEQAREQDLVTAVNLARRADLLAQDLLKRLP